MIRINGSETEAIIYTDVVDSIALEQLEEMANSKVYAGQKIRVMPDVHAGNSATIGTTCTISGKAIPNAVGVDIGCGMETVMLDKADFAECTTIEEVFAKLDELIRNKIPSGMHCRDIPHAYASEIDLSELRCFREINSELAYKSIGSLGGGNHFIEVDKDDEGNFYLVVHSGSRHLGLEVATYYQQEAYKHLCGNSKIQIQQIIQEYKAQGRHREIQAAIEEAQKRVVDIDPASAYVEGALFDDYIHDMKIVQRFAVLSRKAMIDEIVSGMGWHVVEQFTTIHNYIDTEHMILRKGAVSAQKDEILLIPINMRDGSLICRGKGNEDWNCSAPHGAGRLMSRGKARATLEMEEFEREMQGIYTTSVNQSTIDESPMAYKSLADIVDNIEPTVEILKRIVPVYNFKASE